VDLSARFWRTTGKELRGDPTDLAVAFYLLTCPSRDWTGIYYLALPTAAHELGIPEARVLVSLDRLSSLGFADYDPSAELVCVGEIARASFGGGIKPGDKRIKAVRAHLREIGDHPFCATFAANYLPACVARQTKGLPAVDAPAPASPASPTEAPLQGPSEPPPMGLNSESEHEDEDEDPTRAREGRPRAPPERTEALKRVVMREYAERFVVALGCDPPLAANDRAFRDFATWARRAAVRLGVEEIDVVRPILDRFFRDEWAVAHDYPPRALAKQPTRYAPKEAAPA